MDEFNLTPSPALLDLLGKIPFKGWQCIAELIDNSIDAIISHNLELSDPQKTIFVSIPTKSKISQNEPVVIEDFAIGMTDQQLENAVKAGFSNKRTGSNLGLFGMGFNVATSRLANAVQVWSSTADMDYEVGVCIDLREMKSSGSFIRPKMRREKTIGKRSGTRIEIFDFKPEAHSLLKPQDILRELNRAYSDKIFNHYGIKIEVNGQMISPYRFCVWNSNRSVKYKYTDVPAIIPIDTLLNEEMFCENCYAWLGNKVETTLKVECPYCHNSDYISTKQIRITGWVGIQRYSDNDNYGIDFSRNGRILSRLDKSLFSWEDDRVKEDTRFHPEYPRDTTYAGGRIVGQIEVNFVIPKYTKDDFEREDKNWRLVIKYLRGEMPLQPELASSFGYKETNRTPISLLFNAYRKINVPGSKTLVFAKENGDCDHTTSRNWATKFYEDDPEYQDDTKWWEAVIKADLKENQSTFNPLAPRSKRPTSKDDIKITPPNADKFPGRQILKKTMTFDIEKLIGEGPMTLTLIDYTPENDLMLPIIFDPDGPRKFKVYLNNNHPIFRDFADGYEDLIYMEVASKFKELKGSEEWPTTRIYYELKSKYAPGSMLNVPNLVTKANNLMRDIQNKLVRGDGMEMPRLPLLSETDERALKKKYLDLEGKALPEMKLFLLTTKFLKYLDLNFLFKFIADYPEVIFDGKVLSNPYNELDNEQKEDQLKKYLSWFEDVKWFMNDLSKEGDEAIKKLKPQIIRNRYSLEILYDSISK